MNYCLSRDFCQEVEVGCKIFLHRNPRAVQSALKHLLELLRHAWPCRKLRRAGLGMDKDAARPTQQVLLVHGQVSDVIKSCQHVECSCEGFSGREAYLASGPSGLPLPDLCRRKVRKKRVLFEKESGASPSKMERMNASVRMLLTQADCTHAGSVDGEPAPQGLQNSCAAGVQVASVLRI